MTVRHRWFSSLLAVAAIAAPAGAQTQARNIQRIQFYRIKGGRAQDFEAATKEYAAAVKKAGSRRDYTMWQALTGPREFVRVLLYSKWADLDASQASNDVEIARISRRIGDSTESTREVIAVIQPDASLPFPAKLPPMIEVEWRQLQPGKRQDALALMKETLPDWKAGTDLRFTANVTYGDTAPAFESVFGFSNWARFDTPGRDESAMGAEKYRQYIAKLAALTVRRQIDVYRLRSDLSYQPGSAASAPTAQ